MNNIWLMIFGVMVIGNILRYIFPDPMLAAIIDLGVLGGAYLILRRYPYVDLKRSMLFLSIVMGVAVLVDLGLLHPMIGDIAMLCVLAWMFFSQGRRPGKPQRIRHQWHK